MTEVTNQGLSLGLVTAKGGARRQEPKNSEKIDRSLDRTEFNKTLNEKLEPSKPKQAQEEPQLKETTSVKIQEKKTQATDKDSISKEISQKNLEVLANKQQAVLDFMDSIESELGIPHEDLQGALAEIIRSDPDQKIENAAEILFSYFNLSAEQMSFAKTEFEQLQGQLKTLDEKLLAVPKSTDALQASLVDLSSRFFMKSNPQVRLNRDAAPLSSPDVLKGLNVKSIEMEATEPKNNPSLLLAGIAVSDMKTKSLSGLSELFQATLSNENQIRVLNGQQSQDTKIAEQILNDFTKSINDLGQVVQQKQGMNSYKDLLSSDDGESDNLENFKSNTGQESLVSNNIGFKDLSLSPDKIDSLKTLVGGSATANSMTAQPNAIQTADNVRWVNQQVQQLVKQGGGESKILMTPEGLGKLQLKVELQEGKVNISMAAEKAETMQMIEKSSHLLKEGLDKNNLELGKITFEKSLSSDVRNQDFGSDSKQFQEQARGFLGNFRDENFNRRQDWFYETPSMKAYRSQSIDAPSLKPTAESNVNSAYKTSKKGSGLDLVA